jgi:hypothetical protein
MMMFILAYFFYFLCDEIQAQDVFHFSDPTKAQEFGEQKRSLSSIQDHNKEDLGSLSWGRGRSLFPNEFNFNEFIFIWQSLVKKEKAENLSLSQGENKSFVQSLSSLNSKVSSGSEAFLKSSYEAYMSVGSERSFIGASLSQAEFLVGFDFDLDIVKFNKINAVLLGLSESRQDYWDLRFQTSFDKIQKRLVQNPWGLTLSFSEWSWWVKEHEKDSRWRGLFFVSNQTQELQQKNLSHHHHSDHQHSLDQKLASYKFWAYWFRDDYWNHLRFLARQGRMEFFHLDLQDTESLKFLLKKLKERGVRVRAFDTSNVLNYVGSQAMTEALDIILESLDFQEKLKWISTQPRLKDSFDRVSSSQKTGSLSDTGVILDWTFYQKEFQQEQKREQREKSIQESQKQSLQREVELRIVYAKQTFSSVSSSPFCGGMYLKPL